MEQVINLRFFGSLGFAASLLLFTPNKALSKAEMCAPCNAMTKVLEEFSLSNQRSWPLMRTVI